MKKRLDPMWRVIVALLLIAAIAPAVVLSGAVDAAAPGPQDPPDTYIDPIPEYVNASFIDTLTWLTGTSICAQSRTVSDVEVQIINDSDGYCWDDGPGDWRLPCEWNDADFVVGGAWGDHQKDWEYIGGTLPGSGNFRSGWSYTVKARAIDDDNYKDPMPATANFTYDDADPDVSFTTVFPGTIYDKLDVIEGTASDDDGEVDQVRVMIRNVNDDTYWNGLWWQPTPNSVWLMTDGTLEWEITDNTVPALPEWRHNTDYKIKCKTSDKADNRDVNMEGPRTFLFREELTASATKPGLHMDPIPEWTNALPGFSGTSRSIVTRTITDVRVMIQDKSENPDVWWDETLGDWNDTKPVWPRNIGGAPAVIDAWGQYDWNFPTSVDPDFWWKDGHEYTIQAWCMDSAVPGKEATTSTQTFTFDNADPASVIDAFDVIVYNHWGSLTGWAEDSAGGEIGMVVVLIERLSDGLFWNGAGWGIKDWSDVTGNWWDWVFAEPGDKDFGSVKEAWKVTSSTAQELPPLKNGETYDLAVHALDKAGNEETTALKQFTFKYDMSDVAHATPTPEPSVTQSPGPPGPTPEPTYSPGPGPSATETPTATETPISSTSTPEATPTVVSPTATPTATSTAGEGGMEWVWWHYLIIGLGAALFIALIVLIIVKPSGGGGEAGGEAGEEAVEEEEL